MEEADDLVKKTAIMYFSAPGAMIFTCHHFTADVTKPIVVFVDMLFFSNRHCIFGLSV